VVIEPGATSGEPGSPSTTRWTTSGGTAIDTVGYAYTDEEGNLTARTEMATGIQTLYT
jgi:hypothetical protein